MADSIEEVVYTYLTSDSTFIAKFHGVYWMDATEAEAVSPYIVFWLVDDTGVGAKLNTAGQGEARIQFDLWDTNKIRGARLRTDLRNKIMKMGETSGGYMVIVTGISEKMLQRESTTDPYHFIVDAIIKWNKG